MRESSMLYKSLEGAQRYLQTVLKYPSLISVMHLSLLVCFLFIILLFSLSYKFLFVLVIFFDCRKEFADIIMECWRDDAGQRPSSVQLLEKLEAAIESFASSIPPSVSSTITTASAHSISSCRFATAGHPFSLSPRFYLSFFLSFSYIVTAEMVTTLAGSGKSGFNDSKALQASFHWPHGICINPWDECLYVCEQANNAIRRVNMQGIHTLEPSYTSSFLLIYHDLQVV